jgi:hypothetical protein
VKCFLAQKPSFSVQKRKTLQQITQIRRAIWHGLIKNSVSILSDFDFTYSLKCNLYLHWFFTQTSFVFSVFSDFFHHFSVSIAIRLAAPGLIVWGVKTPQTVKINGVDQLSFREGQYNGHIIRSRTRRTVVIKHDHEDIPIRQARVFFACIRQQRTIEISPFLLNRSIRIPDHTGR